jgi:6-pyruvoyltetrahydropterin/6-carboxytetrahydropterin synthase
VMDLSALDAMVQKEILDRFDHTNLNLSSEFSEAVPTTENLIVRIYELLRGRLGEATLENVVVEETGNNTFQYAGQKEILH